MPHTSEEVTCIHPTHDHPMRTGSRQSQICKYIMRTASHGRNGHGTDAATSSPTTKTGDQTMSLVNIPIQVNETFQQNNAVAVFGGEIEQSNVNLTQQAQQSAFFHQFIF
jgi:hypothetical protein